MSERIPSYQVGEIDAQGAFTAEIHIKARASLQDVWNDQYHGSQIMGKRPGMYLKYLPCRFHEVNGDILTGGSYLFHTLKDAKDYENWTSNDFQVGEPKTTFWKQPLFESVNHWTWTVIGAHNFTPVSEHAIGRFQRWKYDSDDADSVLHQLYPTLKEAAQKLGASSFWLLHCPEDRMIAAQLSFPREKEDDDESIREQLVSVTQRSCFVDVFPDSLKTRILLDRVSPYLAVWLPLTESHQGVYISCPIIPNISIVS